MAASLGSWPRSRCAIFATTPTRSAIWTRVKPSGKTTRNGLGVSGVVGGWAFVPPPPLMLATANHAIAKPAIRTAIAANRRR